MILTTACTETTCTISCIHSVQLIPGIQTDAGGCTGGCRRRCRRGGRHGRCGRHRGCRSRTAGNRTAGDRCGGLCGSLGGRGCREGRTATVAVAGISGVEQHKDQPQQKQKEHTDTNDQQNGAVVTAIAPSAAYGTAPPIFTKFLFALRTVIHHISLPWNVYYNSTIARGKSQETTKWEKAEN